MGFEGSELHGRDIQTMFIGVKPASLKQLMRVFYFLKCIHSISYYLYQFSVSSGFKISNTFDLFVQLARASPLKIVFSLNQDFAHLS